MGFTVTVDGARRQLRVVADGAVTADAVRAHLASERADGALGYAELIDARSAAPVVSSSDVRAVVDLLTGLARDGGLGPTAVVVSTDYAYGMLRMLEILADGVAAVRPFRDLTEAEHWLAAVAPSAHGDRGTVSP